MNLAQLSIKEWMCKKNMCAAAYYEILVYFERKENLLFKEENMKEPKGYYSMMWNKGCTGNKMMYDLKYM